MTDYLPEVADPLLPTMESRQITRMAALPDVYKTPTERIACELSMGMEEPAAIFAHYEMTPEQGMALLSNATFLQILGRVSQEVKTSGVSFKMKARMQAEELLGVSYEIATDALAPMSVRADLIKWTGLMAGLTPKSSDTDDKGKGGGGLNLVIQFANQPPQKVVSSEPLTIEQS